MITPTPPFPPPQICLYLGFVGVAEHPLLVHVLAAAHRYLHEMRTHDMLNVIRGACLAHGLTTDQWRHVAGLFATNTWKLVDVPAAISQIFMVNDLVKLKHDVDLVP